MFISSFIFRKLILFELGEESHGIVQGQTSQPLQLEAIHLSFDSLIDHHF